jgi:hypothetical protein
MPSDSRAHFLLLFWLLLLLSHQCFSRWGLVHRRAQFLLCVARLSGSAASRVVATDVGCGVLGIVFAPPRRFLRGGVCLGVLSCGRLRDVNLQSSELQSRYSCVRGAKLLSPGGFQNWCCSFTFKWMHTGWGVAKWRVLPGSMRHSPYHGLPLFMSAGQAGGTCHVLRARDDRGNVSDDRGGTTSDDH